MIAYNNKLKPTDINITCFDERLTDLAAMKRVNCASPRVKESDIIE